MRAFIIEDDLGIGMKIGIVDSAVIMKGCVTCVPLVKKVERR